MIGSIFLILSLSLLQSLIQYEKKNSQTLWFLEELGFFYSVLLTELDTLLHLERFSKFEDKMVIVPV